MNKKLSLFALVTCLVLVSAVLSASSAFADQSIASVACTGSAPGLADCTITLSTAIAPGGSLTATVTDSGAQLLACNTLPPGGPCTLTPTTATFACASGCTAGSTYRDVVQLLQGSGQDQSFTASGALIALASIPNPSTAVYPVPATPVSSLCFTPQGVSISCGGSGLFSNSGCFAQGLLISCAGTPFFASTCLSSGPFGAFNSCANTSLIGLTSGCLTPSFGGLVDLCGGAFSPFPSQGCVVLSPTGVTVNLCGFQQFTTTANLGLLGANCVTTVSTLSGPVEVQVC